MTPDAVAVDTIAGVSPVHFDDRLRRSLFRRLQEIEKNLTIRLRFRKRYTNISDLLFSYCFV